MYFRPYAECVDYLILLKEPKRLRPTTTGADSTTFLQKSHLPDYE
jgi:hypothetical protein